MKLTVVSEDSILIQVGEVISESLIPRIAVLCELIEGELGYCLIDLVPSYTTVLCRYDLLQMDHLKMLGELQRLVEALDSHLSDARPGNTIEIPVWYAPEVGADLISLAEYRNLAVEAVIERHSGKTYRVFAVGFSPGFAFLGQVHESLAIPRHSTPRAAVAAGSVGIADTQTAVYPRQSPGGWQIIGRSPQVLFNARGTIEQASLLKVGDKVRFCPIDQSTFLKLGGRL